MEENIFGLDKRCLESDDDCQQFSFIRMRKKSCGVLHLSICSVQLMKIARTRLQVCFVKIGMITCDVVFSLEKPFAGDQDCKDEIAGIFDQDEEDDETGNDDDEMDEEDEDFDDENDGALRLRVICLAFCIYESVGCQ